MTKRIFRSVLSSAIALHFLGISSEAPAYFETADPNSNRSEMNGISFSKYAHFTEKWKLVTVRYREDSKEVRLVYANEKAWKGLQSLKPEYPDGAAFAKVAMTTESDPAFLSSRIPSVSQRYQLMVKDQKRYKDSDGWGYALFDSSGHLFKEDIQITTTSCIACHRMVPERNFVFSRAVHFGPELINTASMSTAQHSTISFKPKKRSDFPNAENYLVGSNPEVESLEGALQKNGFSGTLEEIVPILLDRSKRFERDSVFFLNSENFTAVSKSQVDERKDTCPNSSQSHFKVVIVFNSKKVRDSELCQ